MAKPVRGLHHDLQPLHALRGELRPVDEEGVGLVGAAAHPAAELVQRGQTEALGVLDDHAARVGHVDADLHDAGGHEDLHVACRETAPSRIPCPPPARASGSGPSGCPRRRLLEHSECGFRVLHVERLRLLDQRVHEIGLPSRARSPPGPGGRPSPRFLRAPGA